MSLSIQNFFDASIFKESHDWLIAGKGPTLDKVSRDPTIVAFYKIMTLNHAVKVMPFADIAHIIDIEVLDDAKTALALDGPKYLAMPWYPHVNQRPKLGYSLPWFVERKTILKRLFEKGRLLWYNLSSCPDRCPYVVEKSRLWTHRPIHAQYFSAEAAFDLLSQAGAEVIHTIGIDGGSDRSAAFADIPFDNPHGTYDAQFHNIEAMAAARGIDYKRL